MHVNSTAFAVIVDDIELRSKRNCMLQALTHGHPEIIILQVSFPQLSRERRLVCVAKLLILNWKFMALRMTEYIFMI